jgi:hypothetical protein
MRLGFVTEVSFQNTRYEENSRRIELLRSSIATSSAGRSSSIRSSSGRHMGLGQPMDGTSSRRCFCDGNTQRLLPRLSTMERSKASMFSRAPSLKFTSYSPAAIGPCGKASRSTLALGFDVGNRGLGMVLKSRLEWDWGEHPKR